MCSNIQQYRQLNGCVFFSDASVTHLCIITSDAGPKFGSVIVWKQLPCLLQFLHNINKAVRVWTSFPSELVFQVN